MPSQSAPPNRFATSRNSSMGEAQDDGGGANARLSGALTQLRAKTIVMATGAIERPLVFSNNDRPGVMLASALRSYANRYPQPHLLAQEARYQLVQLYQAQRDLSRQNFWREKIASFEQQFASEGNERTQQLAAQALLQLGQHESSLFAVIRLSHPLRQSLQQQRQHMSSAIKHYEQAISYGVASLVSEAQFRVAELYQQMATALPQSDRPNGLDELALEEYELLLEEQAFPFEEQAIAIYQQNTRLTQQQVWDSWVQQSFTRLAQLLPAKFNKTEAYTGVADAAD